MSRRRTVEDWRIAVYRSNAIGDPVRVLLLYMADHMTPTRCVSVPRRQLADALDKSERRISERITAAHDAGFLGTKEPGYRGHTAVYQGLFGHEESGTAHSPLSSTDSRESGTHTSPLSSAETRPLSTEESGTPVGPTNRRADLTASQDHPNDGSKEVSMTTSSPQRTRVSTQRGGAAAGRATPRTSSATTGPSAPPPRRPRAPLWAALALRSQHE